MAVLSSGCLEELLQLRPCDVYETQGIWVIDIGADGAQVKTPLRPRLVLVHSQLKKLGFLEYIAECARKVQALVFPGFLAAGPDQRFGHTYTRFWTEYRRQIGYYARGADFHALRHSVNTRLVNAGVSQIIIRQIMGHAQQGMTGKVYNSGIELAACAEAIEKLRYDSCINFDELAQRAGR
ncbi:tyrosine-type recombinase/integrase [Belnapia rosea]|uniref:tyrosine-type recombinase/integrase n=1 Tax=Belnapia rosea TaxID=938405 RepID=UPI0015A03821|nr:tyrosine-type recombinase/integrase [Belnapia rosea]